MAEERSRNGAFKEQRGESSLSEAFRFYRQTMLFIFLLSVATEGELLVRGKEENLA
jgi:hypothetical protein